MSFCFDLLDLAVDLFGGVDERLLHLVYGLWLGISGFGFRVSGFGLRVEGPGFGV